MVFYLFGRFVIFSVIQFFIDSVLHIRWVFKLQWQDFLLFILTSIWKMCTPNYFQNLLFYIFCMKQLKNEDKWWFESLRVKSAGTDNSDLG